MITLILISIVLIIAAGVVGWRQEGVEFGVLMSVIALCIIGTIFAITFAIVDAQTDSQCKAAGWREGSLNVYSGIQYCVTRSDQTDIIRPLDEALRNPR